MGYDLHFGQFWYVDTRSINSRVSGRCVLDALGSVDAADEKQTEIGSNHLYIIATRLRLLLDTWVCNICYPMFYFRLGLSGLDQNKGQRGLLTKLF